MVPTHTGSCHCGTTRFEIDADIDHVRICDCSICSKRGTLIFRVPKHNLRLLTPKENLSTYKWGAHTGEDYFCRECGILPFRKPSALSKQEIAQGMKPFDGWAINVRCLTDFDYADLPIVSIKGSEISMP